MVQPGGELDLAQEAFRTHRGGELGVQHLDRSRPAVLQVVGQENRGCPSTGELALDPIAAGEPGLQTRRQVYRGQRQGLRRSGTRPDRCDERLCLGGGCRRVILGEPAPE